MESIRAPHNPAANDNGERRRAEKLAASAPSLLLAAQRVAETVMLGQHGRRRKGLGAQFWQFRGYEAGDSVQAIDWRQTAKRGHVHIREYEWEAAQTVWLWCDLSSSMAYRSSDDIADKATTARLLLLALAIILLRNEEQVGLANIGQRPQRGRKAIHLLWQQLQSASQQPTTVDFPAPPSRSGFAHMVLFGDFLTPPEILRQALSSYAEQGMTGLLCQIADPAEEDFPFTGRTRFEGLEGEQPLLLGRADAAQQNYRHRFTEWRAEVAEIAGQCGWQALYHRTDQAPEAALLAINQALAERMESA